MFRSFGPWCVGDITLADLGDKLGEKSSRAAPRDREPAGAGVCDGRRARCWARGDGYNRSPLLTTQAISVGLFPALPFDRCDFGAVSAFAFFFDVSRDYRSRSTSRSAT